MSNIPAEIRPLFEGISNSLNAYMVENPQDPNYLGEPWISHLKNLKTSLNSSLEKLPPTDQVPAAQQAHWGIESVKSALMTVQSIISSLNTFVKAKAEQTQTALNSIPQKVEEGIQTKLTSGDYVKKEDAATLASTARTEGEKTGYDKALLLGNRRMALASAGLPPEVASTAPEALLLGDEAAFNAARDAAKDRLSKLNTVGLTVASATDAIKSLAWAEQPAFDVQFSTFEAIKNASKGQSNNSVTTKPAAQPNPFLVGTPTTTAKEGDKPTKFVLAL